jgi:hypothetical protein
MKKLLFLSLLVFVSGFFSCEKCRSCSIITLCSNNNWSAHITNGELCGNDLKLVGKTSYSYEIKNGKVDTCKTLYRCGL